MASVGSLGCDGDPSSIRWRRLPFQCLPGLLASFPSFLELPCSPPHLWLRGSDGPWMSSFTFFNFSCFVSFLRDVLHYVEIGC